MTRRRTDEELVQGSLSGDRSSFDALVDRYRDGIFRLMLYRVNRPDLAEDLAQDAFVSAYRSLPQLSDPAKFGAWLRKVAINVCNGRLRGRHGECIPLDESLVSSAPDPSAHAEARMVARTIEEALSRLSEANRDTSLMYFIEGLSQDEIAAAQDLPITTVKRRINLARTRLRKEMIGIMESEFRAKVTSGGFSSRVSARVDVLRWYSRFSEYITSGTSLVRSLHSLAQADFPDAIRRETSAIQRAIESGATLSEAIAAHAPTLNHPKAAGLVRAGEVGGILEWSLSALVTWAEHEDISRRIDTAYWLRTFASMLTAGVPIVQAAETMANVKASEPLGELPGSLVNDLATRKSITATFRRFPDTFGPSTLALIRAGEKSGLLDQALNHAASTILHEASAVISGDPAVNGDIQGLRGIAETLISQFDDPSPKVRLGVLRAMDSVDREGSLIRTMCVRSLADEDASVRLEGARVLRRRPAPDAVQQLLRLTHEASSSVRAAALSAIDVADQTAALKSAERLLTDGSVEVRLSCVPVIGRGPLPRSAELLVGMLSDEELPVVKDAMHALVRMGSPALAVLVQAAERMTSEAALSPLDAIILIDRSVAREVALRMLASGRVSGGRRAPISVLSQVADPEDARHLIEALSDPDPLTVRDAVDGLGRMKAESAVPSLIEVLNGERDRPAVRAAAALGRIGDVSAAPALAGMLTVEHPRQVVAACLEALGALGSTQYSDTAIDMVLAFGRRGQGLGDGPITLVDQAGVRRMVRALGDPTTAVTATHFLCTLAGRREDGPELLGNAEAVPTVMRVLGMKPLPEILPQAVYTLVRMVGREEALRLIGEASSRGGIDHGTADRAAEIAKEYEG